MNLGALFNQRRNRRLTLAIFAALMVHIGLMVSGDWSISMFSAPSTEDRVLTLTLENTNYEGLKETADLNNETINNVKLAKPAMPKEVVPVKPVSSQSRPIQTSKKNEPIIVEALATTNQNQQSFSEELPQQDSDLSQSDDSLSQGFKINASASKQEQSNDVEELLPRVSPQQSDVESNVYTAAKGNLLLNTKTVLNGAGPKSSFEPIKGAAAESIKKTLTSKQQSKVEKKIQRLVTKFKSLESVPDVLDWSDSGKAYTAQFTPVPAESDMQTDELLVEVFTEQDGKKLTTSLRFKKLAFSNFAQFVNQWNSNVSIHDDVLDGRFHSNTEIKLTADRKSAPVFHGKVTTASYQVNYNGRARKKNIFKGGLETGVKKIRMPRPRQLFSEKNAAHENVVVLNQDARLIFTADGHYLWQALDEIRPMEKHEIGEQALYFIAAPSVSLNVSGVVNGTVAIYSARRITIEDDVLYKDKGALENGGDFLGLVSGGSVVIDEREKMDNGDLTIHASIYANSRFAVKDIRGERSGTMNIFGSVSASTITATEPRYATNIVFDPRLENLRPPGFPVTDRYELIAQDEQWTVVQDAYFDSIDDAQPEFDGVSIDDNLF